MQRVYDPINAVDRLVAARLEAPEPLLRLDQIGLQPVPLRLQRLDPLGIPFHRMGGHAEPPGRAPPRRLPLAFGPSPHSHICPALRSAPTPSGGPRLALKLMVSRSRASTNPRGRRGSSNRILESSRQMAGPSPGHAA